MKDKLPWSYLSITYVDKWLCKKQPKHKLSNFFWKPPGKIDAKITQTLKFRDVGYVRNHRENIFWPLVSPRLCPHVFLTIRIIKT